METRANYVIVGIFTIAAVLAAFAFVYWTAAIGDRGETALLRFRIPGSASGLTRGSAVLFNGVRVGDIQRVYIDVTNPSAAIADAQVDRITPVTRSTTAVVGLAGLTGTANIEMNGGSLNEQNLFAEAAAEGRVAEIVANPSAVTNLLQTAQQIFERADNVLTQLEGFTKDARPPLLKTVENAQKFTDALAENADGIDKFLTSVSSLEELAGLSGKLDGTIKKVDDILNSVDRNKITSIVDNAQTFSQNLTKSSEQFDSVVGGADGALGAQQTLRKLQDLLGSENAEGVIAQANETLKAYRRVADNINNRMTLLDDASKTLAAYRQVAETVQGRIGGIMDGISRFSGQGLRGVKRLCRMGVGRSTGSKALSPTSAAIRSASLPVEMEPFASMTAGHGVDIPFVPPQDGISVDFAFEEARETGSFTRAPL
jgi:phospholipid/cholesterol/gamma-HCH transport system substrate-binding protein